MKKLAILASGSGTNAENIHQFFARGNRIAVDIVIYDRRDAGVAARMARYGVETLFIPGTQWREHPDDIVRLLRSRGIDLVVLAGFLRHIPDEITTAFAGRIINIHPSLLPAYGGKGMYGHKVHEAVIAAGEKKSGVTVHYVTPEYDAGPIVMQQEVEITPEDTAETLEAKIHQAEYQLFPRAIVAALAEKKDASQTPPDINGTDITTASAGTETTTASTGTGETTASTGTGTATPPPMPPAEEWARTLNIPYEPAQAAEPAKSAQPSEGAGTTPHAMPEPGFPRSQYQQPMPGYGYRPTGVSDMTSGTDRPPMPPTNMVWAVICTVLCCFIPGIIAIIMSSRVSSRYYAGDFEGAKRASDATQWWIIASFVLGILSATLYIPLSLI